MRALLVAGSRTPSHLAAALQRYSELIGRLLAASPSPSGGGDGQSSEAAQKLLLVEAADFYREVRVSSIYLDPPESCQVGTLSAPELHDLPPAVPPHIWQTFPTPPIRPQVPQKVLMVVDQLTALKLLSTSQLVSWALRPTETSGSGSRSGSGSVLVPSSSAWETVYYGLSRAFSRRQQISEQVT